MYLLLRICVYCISKLLNKILISGNGTYNLETDPFGFLWILIYYYIELNDFKIIIEWFIQQIDGL